MMIPSSMGCAVRAESRGGGLFYNLAVGLVGAIVGGLIFNSLHISPEGLVGALVSATVGAVVFLLIWRAIRRA